MPVTLAQAQLNTQADIDYAVIDNLRRNSWLLNNMVWDDTATPGTGGGALTYGYTRLLTPSAAAFRRFNEEYAPNEASRERKTVDLHPLGGAFNIDRKLARLGPAATNEIMFQMSQKLTSVRTRFQQELILGDLAVDDTGFDGLDKALVGQSTEYLPINEGISSGFLDWSPATVNSEDLAMSAFDAFDDFLSRIMGSQTGSGDSGADGSIPAGTKAILGNTKSISRIKALARRAAQFTSERNSLGVLVERYGDFVLVDLGDRADGSAPIIPIRSADVDGGGAGGVITGLTDIYAVSIGLDAFHGASMAGSPLVETWLPDFTQSGAVKTGEVEMGPIAAVLRNTKACGVLRNVKVR
ncbi:phage major capsid protein [Streptomyces sp. WAC 06738]|uniref:major capsid protein n=1 Tax=Streptomyces sp. WAC 06738 TaxID=2203210 RepID=UPI000F6FDD76|nr:phage major capsid protein [Streptomyces sp. WAC 06738]AZM46573.1 phage major capsid protein [Streptomyces sp. WAC 06738]